MLFALLPLIACVAIGLGWTRFSPYSELQGTLFLMLAVPFAFAMTASGMVASLLVLLAPSKGARIVAYAQRRLAPMVGLLLGIAIAGSVVSTPQVRIAIGPATGDLLSLVFDLAVPIFAGLVIWMHRRTVRSLIVRGHPPAEDGKVLNRAIYWLGTSWHHFGFAFVILNIGARLFGTRSVNFLTQSSLSVVLIVLAFIAVTTIRRFESRRVTQTRRRTRSGVRTVIIARLASIVYRGVQIAAVVIAIYLCLGLWGIDVGRWLGSEAGLSVMRPVRETAPGLSRR